MEFKLGSQTINEYIKEYLSYNNFKNTYDCFSAELQAKTVSTKLVNKESEKENANQPRIYNFLKADNEKTEKENALEREFVDLMNNYKKLITASRNILSASITMLDFMEKNKNVKKKKINF